MYLIYNTQQQAQQDLKEIYKSMIQELACYHSGTMKNIQNNEIEYILDKEEVKSNEYPIFSSRRGKKLLGGNYTTAWAVEQQNSDGKWFIPKPKHEWSAGLIGEEVETIEFSIDEAI